MVIFSVFIFLSSFFYFLNEFVYSWILNIFTVEFCLCWWLSLLVWLVVPSQTSLPCFKCPFMTFKNLSHNVVSITHRHGRESNSVVKGTNYECRCISNYIVQYYHDWVWRAGVHTGKLGHMIPLWKRKNLIYFGVNRSKVKVTYYKYNFWQQGCFRMITLVLYIGSLPNLTTWFPCGRGGTLFNLGSLGQRSWSLLLWI